MFCVSAYVNWDSHGKENYNTVVQVDLLLFGCFLVDILCAGWCCHVVNFLDREIRVNFVVNIVGDEVLLDDMKERL